MSDLNSRAKPSTPEYSASFERFFSERRCQSSSGVIGNPSLNIVSDYMIPRMGLLMENIGLLYIRNKT